jgi:hypothetical protein
VKKAILGAAVPLPHGRGSDVAAWLALPGRADAEELTISNFQLQIAGNIQINWQLPIVNVLLRLTFLLSSRGVVMTTLIPAAGPTAV